MPTWIGRPRQPDALQEHELSEERDCATRSSPRPPEHVDKLAPVELVPLLANGLRAGQADRNRYLSTQGPCQNHLQM